MLTTIPTRRSQIAIARLKTGHLKILKIIDGKKIFPVCPKCDTKEISPQHILQCMNSSTTDLCNKPTDVIKLLQNNNLMDCEPGISNNNISVKFEGKSINKSQTKYNFKFHSAGSMTSTPHSWRDSFRRQCPPAHSQTKARSVANISLGTLGTSTLQSRLSPL